jgi:hypothetical protein
VLAVINASRKAHSASAKLGEYLRNLQWPGRTSPGADPVKFQKTRTWPQPPGHEDFYNPKASPAGEERRDEMTTVGLGSRAVPAAEPPMTQALAGFNRHGIVLATDSLASLRRGRAPGILQRQPFPCRIAPSPAAAPASACPVLALRQEIAKRRGVKTLKKLRICLVFLARTYARHPAHHGYGEAGLRRIYFILAGYSPTCRRRILLTSWGRGGRTLHSIPVGAWWSCPATWHGNASL